MIPKKERQRMSNIIYNNIVDRLQEIVDRAIKRDLNDAYLLAFQIGSLLDIENSLKKVKT